MTTVPISADSSPSVVLELLYSFKVKDAMTKDLVKALPSSSLREVQILMRDHAITGVPIEEDGRLLGIVSIGDIIGALDSGTINHLAREVDEQLRRHARRGNASVLRRYLFRPL